ncbi:MAG TPA: AbrB/MazE/SpoVT family DNA-binding domain-containing protein [Tepidisphaeraceae bacterium]|jgi:AbrB family looped-hinge helix DNA binding protein
MRQSGRAVLRVADGGRIVIPAEVRQHLGMEVGAEVVLIVEGDHATLMNAKAARRMARERVGRHIPSTVSLSKELMAERKVEGERE